MEGICGIFSSEVAATWVGAAGQILAASVAVWIYYRMRRDQRRDLEGRREVLHAVLNDYIVRQTQSVREAYDRLRVRMRKDLSPTEVRVEMTLLAIEDFNRLVELQGDLLALGQPRDTEIAKFIELCRRHVRSHKGWSTADAIGQCAENGASLPLLSMEASLKALVEQSERLGR